MHARSVFFHMQRKNSTPKGTMLKDPKAWLSRRQIKFPTHWAHAHAAERPRLLQGGAGNEWAVSKIRIHCRYADFLWACPNAKNGA
jgi:hypothetical protein